ncbi:MAG TPA: hypothetical protein VH300_08940 [Thermoleophilaceae bacterium]|nr:hypothetical protein [Thermoleophilaceae bacterium]
MGRASDRVVRVLAVLAGIAMLLAVVAVYADRSRSTPTTRC